MQPQMFVIEDEEHAEQHGQFSTMEAAIAELEHRAAIPWDQEPNVAPCTNWRNCGRRYELVEYDDIERPWKELRRFEVLEVSAAGVLWSRGFGGGS